jgi:hypothetical protein
VLDGKLLLAGRHRAESLLASLLFRRGAIEISTLSLVPIHEADDATSARNARLSWMPSYHNV